MPRSKKIKHFCNNIITTKTETGSGLGSGFGFGFGYIIRLDINTMIIKM